MKPKPEQTPSGKATGALEALPPSDQTPRAIQEAERARLADIDAALIADGAPCAATLPPVTAATLADIAGILADTSADALPAVMVAAHAAALAGKNAELALGIRTRMTRSLHGAAGIIAAKRDTGEPRTQNAVERQAPIADAIVRDTLLQILEQVRADFADTVRAIAELQQIGERIEAMRVKRAAFEQAQVEQAARDRQAEAQRRDEEAKARRQRIVEYFVSSPVIAGTRRLLTLGGQQNHLTGLEISELAKAGTQSEYAAVAALYESLTHELRDRVLATRRADTQRVEIVAWFQSQHTRTWTIRHGQNFSGPAIADAIKNAPWDDDSMYVAAQALRKVAA